MDAEYPLLPPAASATPAATSTSATTVPRTAPMARRYPTGAGMWAQCAGARGGLLDLRGPARLRAGRLRRAPARPCRAAPGPDDPRGTDAAERDADHRGLRRGG